MYKNEIKSIKLSKIEVRGVIKNHSNMNLIMRTHTTQSKDHTLKLKK